MKKIGKKRALELLETVVERKGESYVDPRIVAEIGDCVYWDSGQPSCIVGHVLAEIGVTPSEFPNQNAVGHTGLFTRKTEAKAWFTDGAIDVLIRAQTNQDDGFTWGTALEHARRA